MPTITRSCYSFDSLNFIGINLSVLGGIRYAYVQYEGMTENVWGKPDPGEDDVEAGETQPQTYLPCQAVNL
jgi:hypothetical protein